MRFQRKGTFVLVENWNAETMGPLDPARIVEEAFLGEVKRGVYVFPKNANLEFVEYDDTGLMEKHGNTAVQDYWRARGWRQSERPSCQARQRQPKAGGPWPWKGQPC